MGGDKQEVDFESFLLIVTKKVHTSITLKEMKDAFAVLDCYDACHDGTISMSMLQQAFTKYADNKMEIDGNMVLTKMQKN